MNHGCFFPTRENTIRSMDIDRHEAVGLLLPAASDDVHRHGMTATRATAVLLSGLQLDGLDASVLRSPLFAVVRCDRAVVAVAYGFDAARVDAVRGEVVADGPCAHLG